ncbi:putative disease resistance RPP13-like protein 1 isoform X2 [Arachis stenosperma]|uniref:putative disease resistance RPP13-like protein 1 isoform X2 n=1 Tax=Arachis stenosperma TaxID=217475 RepID=UPI0025ABD20C|nr:putative disease resistance RPP13-like protein 1 isoform X2 [Arachis stenosperma]XP_057743848.1 putative disease resistance RPP13-like protein 1 isoform X2 [Arachis stenosperma]
MNSPLKLPLPLQLKGIQLSYCEKLEVLPCRMQNLVNLRHLDITGTYSLKEMPKGMSKLKHLNFLSDYIVGKHEENGIRDLGALDNLHGLLRIAKLENVNNSREALEAKMDNKKHINILELIWPTEGDIVDVETARDILEELQPHRNLKELTSIGYGGEIFPDWLGFSCYSNITKLRMNGCKNCRQVPSLGQLPFLQHLEILRFDGLERIGSEFYNNDESSHQGTPFRSLQRLTFFGMPRWREWHIPDDFDGFPKLRRLSIERCPVLSGDLPAHLPALEILCIGECPEMDCLDCFGEECLPRSLTTLWINNCQKLERWITSKGLFKSGDARLQGTSPTHLPPKIND